MTLLDPTKNAAAASADVAASTWYSRRARRALGWQHRYALLVLGIDVAVIAASAAAAQLARFGTGTARIHDVPYLLVTLAIVPVWLLSLAAARAYETRFLGNGSEEWKRVFNASVRLIAAVAVVTYALRLPLARGYAGVVLPLGTFLLLVGRYAARRVLHRYRAVGRCTHQVVVVGSAFAVADLVRAMRKETGAGFTVVGACLTDGNAAELQLAADQYVAVFGGLDDVEAALAATGADTIAVTSSYRLTPTVLRTLAWRLEGTGVDLLVAPKLTDVAGPRIHIRPVAGLPLLHVEEPELAGPRQLLKGAVERTLSAIALIGMLPILLVVAGVIRVDSRGPVIFRQTRVGKNGRLFTVYKLRTMRSNSEQLLGEIEHLNEHDGVLFKIRHDPRITRVGRFLRRYSIDELPQLWNVVRGDMSLVGPRPPVPGEVERYELDVHRRLLVKPGVTGLWQVSGRADLTWEDSVRLDLYYVENWSLALDATILWRTLFAVIRGSGAY